MDLYARPSGVKFIILNLSTPFEGTQAIYISRLFISLVRITISIEALSYYRKMFECFLSYQNPFVFV